MPVRDCAPLPRRAVLVGLGASPAAVALIGSTYPAGVATRPSISDPDGIETLWLDYLRLQGIESALRRQVDDAEALLPWWAKPGPSYIDKLGNQVGEVGYAPAIQNMPPPQVTDALRFIRPTETSIGRLRSINVWSFGSQKADQIYQQQLGELESRRNAQQQERVKVGLPDLDRRHDDASDAVYQRYEKIRDLSRHSPALTAAQVMLAAAVFSDVKATATDRTELGIATIALAGLLPSLTGEIAVDAAEFVNNQSRPIRDMRVSRGIEARQEVGAHA